MDLTSSLVAPIAHDAISLLVERGLIEVEPVRIAGAEKDLIAVLERVRRGMEDARGLTIGEEAIANVVERIGEFLLESRNVVEVYASDDELHSMLALVVRKHLVRVMEKPPPRPSSGGFLPPDGGSNSSGGPPAEVRAWEFLRGETAPEPDPENREGPAPEESLDGRRK
jgi:hypothetical protein